MQKHIGIFEESKEEKVWVGRTRTNNKNCQRFGSTIERSDKKHIKIFEESWNYEFQEKKTGMLNFSKLSNKK